MFRFLFLLSNILYFNTTSIGQENIFPFDEAGNILYYEVVETPGNNVEELTKKTREYLKAWYELKDKKFEKVIARKNSYISYDQENNSFACKLEYVVYPGRFLKHAKGAVSYNLIIELKDNKYRYYLNNFVYHPYELNRYGKYVPASGKSVSLNTISLQQEILKKSECDQVEEAVQRNISMLEEYMAKVNFPKEEKSKEAVQINSDW